jgi:sugar lactone lactonase YvrE
VSLQEVLSGLRFPESPRWHEGRLWLSEKRAERVVRIDPDGPTAVVDVTADPGGLGWSPAGDMLVVSMGDRRLLRHRGGELAEVADLAGLTRGKCNDMVVDALGRAYVGDFGYDLARGEEPAGGHIVLVDESGAARVVADDLGFPNGSVVTADGGRLIVAESSAGRLTVFDIADDGSLHGRRVFADLGRGVADGICLDVEGAVWYADPLGCEVVRIAEGGRVLQQISTGAEGAFACVLGGDDGRTLFVCTYSEAASMDASGPPVGRVVAARVEVPSAGSP